jgi:hypothetical protein
MDERFADGFSINGRIAAISTPFGGRADDWQFWATRPRYDGGPSLVCDGGPPDVSLFDPP